MRPIRSTWTVTNVNREPTFDQDLARTGPIQKGPWSSASTPGATDPDSDPLTYAATNLPHRPAINTATGLITGTISSTAAAAQPVRGQRHGPRRRRRVDATDIFTWTVTDVPAGRSHRAALPSAPARTTPSSTSIVLNRPRARSRATCMLASLDVRGTSTVTAPAGWTLDPIPTRTRPACACTSTRRLATESDPATWTWTFSGPRLAAGVIHAYSGVNTDDPDRRLRRSARRVTLRDVDRAVDHHHGRRTPCSWRSTPTSPTRHGRRPRASSNEPT